MAGHGYNNGVGQVFTNFAKKTSFGVIPQIMNSKHMFLKILWTAGLLVGLAMLVVNLYTNVSEYLDYSVNTFYSEGSGKPVFPDITLCNTYQFNVDDEDKNGMSWDYYKYIFSKQEWKQEDISSKINMSLIDSVVENIIKWRREYREEQHEIPKDINRTERDVSFEHGEQGKQEIERKLLRRELLNEVIDYMKTPSMYFANIPYYLERKTPSRSENKSLFITHCRLETWKGYFINCDDYIREIWNPDFFKCYTLKPNLREDIREFTAIVFINNFPEHQAHKFGFFNRRTKTTGVRLVVHSPGTKPKMLGGVSISPGTETTVSIVPLNRTRLKKPWSDTDCTDETHLNGSDTEMYSFEACRDVCIQEEVVNTCGCLSGFHQFTENQRIHVGGRVCGNQSLNEIWKDMVKTPNWTNNMSVWLTGPKAVRGVNEIICLWHGIDYDMDHCRDQCLLPCKEYTYSSSTSPASWPHVYFHKAFYEEYIKGKEDLKRKFIAYERIIDKYKPIDCDSTGDMCIFKNAVLENKLTRAMANISLIEKNYLQVTVKFQSRKPFVLEDRQKFTWDSALGLFGGTIGLWSGLSLLAALEFIDLCYCLVAYFCANRRDSKKNLSKSREFQPVPAFDVESKF